MGYTTIYHLTVYDKQELDFKQWKTLVLSLKAQSFDKNHLLAMYEKPGVSYRWYDHAEDMSKLSLIFPTLTFVISGKGEDESDYWEENWECGKRVTYNGQGSMAEQLLHWLKSHHQDIYKEFEHEFQQRQDQPHDSHGSKIRTAIQQSPF